MSLNLSLKCVFCDIMKPTPIQLVRKYQIKGFNTEAIAKKTGLAPEIVRKLISGERANQPPPYKRNRLREALEASDERKAWQEYGVRVTYEQIRRQKRW